MGSLGNQHSVEFGPYLLEGSAAVLEHVSCDSFAFYEESEQQVLGAHVVVTQPARLIEGDLDHLLDSRRRDDVLDEDALGANEHRLDGPANHGAIQPTVVEHKTAKALVFTKHAQQRRLGA